MFLHIAIVNRLGDRKFATDGVGYGERFRQRNTEESPKRGRIKKMIRGLFLFAKFIELFKSVEGGGGRIFLKPHTSRVLRLNDDVREMVIEACYEFFMDCCDKTISS